MTGFTDRRTSERYNVKVEVNLKRILDSSIFTSFTRDLSRGGLCLNLKSPLEPNEQLKLQMSLILSPDAQSEPLELKGRVAWCSEDDDGQYQIGVSFVSVEEETHKHISTFIELLEDKLPT